MRALPEQMTGIRGVDVTRKASVLEALYASFSHENTECDELFGHLTRSVIADLSLVVESEDVNQKNSDNDEVVSPEARQEAEASCPGYEKNPNPCRCPCYGCRHHCSAHNPDKKD